MVICPRPFHDHKKKEKKKLHNMIAIYTPPLFSMIQVKTNVIQVPNNHLFQINYISFWPNFKELPDIASSFPQKI